MKINVVGTSGTGKSTVSKKLSKILGIPYIEMDSIFWGPNWHWPEDDVFFSNLRAALDRESWVLDGNYTRTIPIKWEKIDVVLWIDFSFARTMYQAVMRAFRRILAGKELWAGTGNIETLSRLFSKDSIVLWTIKTHGNVRYKYEKMMLSEEYSKIKFIRLRSPREVQAFLDLVSKGREVDWYVA